MNVQQAREQYYTHSASASAVGRQLAFAGLAVIWIFKVRVADADRVPPDLLSVAALFATSLACDLLQYCAATLLWGVFQRHKETQRGAAFGAAPEWGASHEKPGSGDFTAPRWINWPALCFFTLKFLILLIGYALLLRVLFGRWVLGAAQR